MKEMENRRPVQVSASQKMPMPLKKGVSLFGTAMLLSAAILPSISAKVLADEVADLEPKTTTHNQTDSTDESNVANSEGQVEAEQVEDESLTEASSTDSEALVEESVETTSAPQEDSEEADMMMAPQMASGPMMRGAGINQEAFIERISSQAKSVAAANNLYASVMIAQAILESSWGNSSLSLSPNHNLFGIKGTYNGQSVSMRTQEVYSGKWVTITAKFRKYPSYSESLQDNAQVIKNTSFQSGVYFYSGAWKSNTRSYRDATAWLTGRYATDPGYAAKLNSLIENNNLTRFDTPGSGTSKPSGNNGGSVTQPDTNGSYTVVSGNTLSGIASRFGVTVANLKSWNKLSSDMIYVGQKLLVKGGATGNTGGAVTPNKPNKPAPSASSSYTVVSGNTLSGIASRFGVTVANLKSWNKLSSDMIYVGQKLLVKGGATGNTGGAVTPNKPNKPNKPAPSASSSYTVVSGNTLSGIASRFGVTVANLKSWNKLSSDIIYVGQKLLVKGGATGNTGGAVTPNKPAPSASSSYTVVSGNTLSGIASRFGVTVANLKSWNKLSSDMIYVGQKLLVKGGATGNTGGAVTPNKPNKPAPSASSSYTIVAGDTLSGIASRYGVTVANLKSWNQLKSDLIFVGQRLSVKGSSSGASTANKPAAPAQSKASTNSSYRVVSGDTLWSLAQKNRVTVKQLLAWNNLSNDVIFVSQVLRVK